MLQMEIDRDGEEVEGDGDAAVWDDGEDPMILMVMKMMRMILQEEKWGKRIIASVLWESF